MQIVDFHFSNVFAKEYKTHCDKYFHIYCIKTTDFEGGKYEKEEEDFDFG